MTAAQSLASSENLDAAGEGLSRSSSRSAGALPVHAGLGARKADCEPRQLVTRHNQGLRALSCRA